MRTPKIKGLFYYVHMVSQILATEKYLLPVDPAENMTEEQIMKKAAERVEAGTLGQPIGHTKYGKPTNANCKYVEPCDMAELIEMGNTARLTVRAFNASKRTANAAAKAEKEAGETETKKAVAEFKTKHPEIAKAK